MRSYIPGGGGNNIPSHQSLEMSRHVNSNGYGQGSSIDVLYKWGGGPGPVVGEELKFLGGEGMRSLTRMFQAIQILYRTSIEY